MKLKQAGMIEGMSVLSTYSSCLILRGDVDAGGLRLCGGYFRADPLPHARFSIRSNLYLYFVD